MKIFVNPKNWGESMISVDWKVLGKRHDKDSPWDPENPWVQKKESKWEAKGESFYSSSTTLSIKELVEPSPRYSQPFFVLSSIL